MGISKNHGLVGERGQIGCTQSFGDRWRVSHQTRAQISTGVAQPHIVGHHENDIGLRRPICSGGRKYHELNNS
jgi:hypothetical protein